MPSDHSWEMGSNEPHSCPIVIALGLSTVICTLFSSITDLKREGGERERGREGKGRERGKGERGGGKGRERGRGVGW